jgi:hypothetical protein
MPLERLGTLKKIHLIGTRTRELPACSIVPQPTTLPRALRIHIFRHNYVHIYIYIYIYILPGGEEADNLTAICEPIF